MNVRDRVVLVTGAARRVGRAIAEGFGAHGARVAVHYRGSAEKAAALAAGIRSRGGEAATFAADLGNVAEVEALADAVTERLGPVDVLVNNASVFYPTPLATLGLEEWQDNLAVNLTAPYVLSLRLGKAMRARGAGKIINIGDSNASRPHRDYVPYSVSKAALETLTAGLAKALAPDVQVNCVALGPILPAVGSTEEERAEVLARTPLSRFGGPDDVVAAVLFLVERDFVTGTTLTVDGGRSVG